MDHLHESMLDLLFVMDRRLKRACDSNTFYEKAWIDMLVQLTTSEYESILPKLFKHDAGLYLNDLGIAKTRVFMEYWHKYDKNFEKIAHVMQDLKWKTTPEMLCIFVCLMNWNFENKRFSRICKPQKSKWTSIKLEFVKPAIQNHRNEICTRVNIILNSLFINNWDINLCTIINQYICFEIPEMSNI